MFCQKGDLLQSQYSGRVFLVLEESVKFKPEIEYTLHLFTVTPYHDTTRRRLKVVFGIDKIHKYNVNNVKTHLETDTLIQVPYDVTLRSEVIDNIEFGLDFMGYY